MRDHWADEITGTGVPSTVGKPFADMGTSIHKPGSDPNRPALSRKSSTICMIW